MTAAEFRRRLLILVWMRFISGLAVGLAAGWLLWG